MAANSKREQIIVSVKEDLETIPSIATVKRSLPTLKDLENFAVTQFPVIAMVAGLPVPRPHVVGRRTAGKDVFISDLNISLYCYFQDNVEPDTQLSNILDDLWATLYADPTRGELAIGTTLKPEFYRGYWEPFYAFRVDVVIQYSHKTGGI